MLNVPKLYISFPSVLALYASGRVSGIVVDCGDGVSNCLPVYEGYALPHAVEQSLLAGRDMTLYLRHLLRQRELMFRSSAELEMLRELKESCCFVVGDYDAA